MEYIRLIFKNFNQTDIKNLKKAIKESNACKDIDEKVIKGAKGEDIISELILTGRVESSILADKIHDSFEGQENVNPTRGITILNNYEIGRVNYNKRNKDRITADWNRKDIESLLNKTR